MLSTSQALEIQTSAVEVTNGKTLVTACESCRLRKLRCLPDASSLSAKCQRCTTSNRECVFTERSRKRRRVRTDTRVNELEKEIKAMSAALKGGMEPTSQIQAKNNSGPKNACENNISTDPRGSISTDGYQGECVTNCVGQSMDKDLRDHLEHESDARCEQRSNERSTILEQSSTPVRSASTMDSNSRTNFEDAPERLLQCNDVIDRGLLSMSEATLLVNRYVNELVQHFPAVILPEGYSAAELRRKRPTLFLAVIAAASGTSDVSLNVKLNREILQIYADRIAIKGERSLELIQSMLITMIWYFPPDDFEELKFYQYIHMAATMALDIGIGTKPRPNQSHLQFPQQDTSSNCDSGLYEVPHRVAPMSSHRPDSGHIESRRTLLACYLKCSRLAPATETDLLNKLIIFSVSISTRRPNMLRFSSWMTECIDFLDTSPDAAPLDKTLVSWVQLQRIMEEFGIAFAFDDLSDSTSLIEPRFQHMLKGFEKQIENWKRTTPPRVLNGTYLFVQTYQNVDEAKISDRSLVDLLSCEQHLST